jgi:DNA-binding transcriptional LysR family regulator
VELFYRLGRRVALTLAGEALVGPARQVLRDLATIDAAVAEVKGLRAGHLDLVALPTLVVEPLAGLLGRFRHAHPQVTVRVVEPEDLSALISLVQHGHAELGLTELPSEETLEQQPLGSQEILAVCPPGTPRGGSRRLPVGELAGVPLVTTPPGTSSRQLVEHALARAGISPLIAVEVGQREALLPLVLAGHLELSRQHQTRLVGKDHRRHAVGERELVQGSGSPARNYSEGIEIVGSAVSKSRIESTPTRRPPSTTGRCRTPSSAMRRAATSSSSSGATITGCSVMYSTTLVVAGSMPSAMAAVRSRSVMMPTNFRSSYTGNAPIW